MYSSQLKTSNGFKNSEFYREFFLSPTKHDVVWGISMDVFLVNFAIINLEIKWTRDMPLGLS